MNKNFSEKIKNLRKNKSMTQEQLSEYFGISIQAVSKWENGLSYPDIELLPEISKLFDVSIDYLLNNQYDIADNYFALFPDDDILRIVQYKGNTLLRKSKYSPDINIPLAIQDCPENTHINIEVWGSANIDGDISGNLTAKGSISCENVIGDITSDECVSCGNIAGGVTAGSDIDCGNIAGSAVSGGDINCGGINGSVDAGGDINCSGIKGSVNSGGSINCGDIDGNVNSGDCVNCGDIGGSIMSCGGDVKCKNIKGDVNCTGNIYYNTL